MKALDIVGNTYYDLSDDPENTYFNIMVYGNRSISGTTFINVEFKEDDNDDGKLGSTEEDNQAGYDSYATTGVKVGDEDIYQKKINVTWDGWRLVSFKYSELVKLTQTKLWGSDGNGVMEPEKVMQISTNILSAPNTKVYCGTDFIAITKGAPLVP